MREVGREVVKGLGAVCVDAAFFGTAAYLLRSSCPMGWAITAGTFSGLDFLAGKVDFVAQNIFVRWAYRAGSLVLAAGLSTTLGYPFPLTAVRCVGVLFVPILIELGSVLVAGGALWAASAWLGGKRVT